MSIKYKCNNCGNEYDDFGSSSTVNLCPNCKSHNVSISRKAYSSTATNCISESIPIKLNQVKTLNEWFTNLPLIQKIDHYNSHIKIIANNLK